MTTDEKLDDWLPTGFELADGVVKKRLIIAVHGLPKTGKSTFALTATGDIGLMDWDKGMEVAVSKAVRKKKVYQKQYGIRPVNDIVMVVDGQRKNDKGKMVDVVRSQNQVTATGIWNESVEDYYKLVDGNLVESIVVDTTDEWHEMARWALLGKLSKVEPFHYGPVNIQFRSIVENAINGNKNVVLVHKDKKAYTGSQWQGDWEMAGYSGMKYIPYLIGKTYRDEKDNDYCFIIEECRSDGGLEGQVLKGKECNFPNLAWMVHGYEETLEDYI